MTRRREARRPGQARQRRPERRRCRAWVRKQVRARLSGRPPGRSSAEDAPVGGETNLYSSGEPSQGVLTAPAQGQLRRSRASEVQPRDRQARGRPQLWEAAIRLADSAAKRARKDRFRSTTRLAGGRDSFRDSRLTPHSTIPTTIRTNRHDHRGPKRLPSRTCTDETSRPWCLPQAGCGGSASC